MKFKSLLLNMARRFGYRPIADTPLLGEKIDYVEAKSTGEMGQILWEIHHGNHEKGMLQLKKLAEQGDAVAQFNYASKYLGAKEYDKAYEWLKKAAAQEMEMAYGQLAHLYHEGLGVTKDYNQAFVWFEKGTIAGDVSARFDLGLMYYQEEYGRQDYQKAKTWFERATAMNDARAQGMLGIMYLNGTGVKQDYQQAREWLEKSAAAGESLAQKYLGDYYTEGLGGEEDATKACEYYEMAAAQDDIYALYIVALSISMATVWKKMLTKEWRIWSVLLCWGMPMRNWYLPEDTIPAISSPKI